MDIDWYDRRRSAVWTVVSGLLAGAVAAFGDHRITVLSPVWPVFGGLAGGAVSIVIGLRCKALPAGVFRAVALLAAAGWVAWCFHYGPWFPNTWAAWAVGTAVLAMASLALPMPNGPNGQGAPDAAITAQVAEVEEAARWEQRLAKVAEAKGSTVTAIEPWPGVPGCYDVVGECADDGTDWMKIKDKERQIVASLRLPLGAGAEVGPGEHSGAFRIGVATVDTLAAEVTYTDTSELTGNGPIPLGRYRDGTAAEATMRLTCSLVVSATNGGKSNYLHTLTAGYVRCPDVLVWHIDLGGAGLALPWLTPWLGGRMATPVIDWAATTVDEAILMTEFALQVNARRRAAYQRLMTEHNTDIVPCSHRLPQIRIILDETAEAAGVAASPRLQANIVRIVQLGRAAGLRFDIAGLRATSTVLPTDAQAQIGLRTVFGVNDDAEVGYTLGWHTKLNLGRARHPGMGWLRLSMADGIRMYRTPRTALPLTVEAIARACEPRRPGLDEPSLNVPLRDAYLSRWGRVVPLLRESNGPAHEPGSPGGSYSAVDIAKMTALATALADGGVTEYRDLPRAADGSVDLGLEPASPAGGFADALARVDRKLDIARLATMPPSVVDERFGRLAEQLEDERVTGPAASSEEAADPRKIRMFELLDTAGPDGLSGHRLAETLAVEGHMVARSTVYEWLGKDAVDGGRGVYIHPKYRQA